MNMKREFFGVVTGVTSLLLATGFTSVAQDKEVIKKNGFTLNWEIKDPNFPAALKTRMTETFFKVYPVLKKQYNKNTASEVTFVIDTAYKAVAEASNARVLFSPSWFGKKPGDIDVVTHEVMHIVQDYGSNSGPWWVTEGIADYVRYTYGVDNAGADWTLPAYKAGQKYDQGYRITARFFVWLEKNGYPNFVKTMDKNMRAHTYTESIWKDITKKSLDELWTAYEASPAI